MRSFLFLFLCTFFSSLVPPLVADDTQQAVDFVRQIQPILKARCYACHGAETNEAGLRLDIRENAFAGSDEHRVIMQGDSDSSLLIRRIVSEEEGERMPPEGKPLSESEIELLKRWIDLGASWPDGVDPEAFDREHWAYQRVAAEAVPAVVDSAWCQNGIDRFVLRHLRKQEVYPSPRADRATLIRRVYLDLLGLPPTSHQWRRWMDAKEPDWYSQMVDELIASPHYGERWGRYWLDLARYADSDGYEKDEPRAHSYQWRDWVIRAFNRDLPFDQFTEQQIAGDLLPGKTPDVHLATGFHRNTLTNREGGIDKEEDRVKQVVDRINTVGTVWLGLTVECAQCHSHKYDPISQREYYQLYAFFNSADESDFPLEPTRAARLEFEQQTDRHQSESGRLEFELKELREQVADDLLEQENEWLARFPDGIAQPADRDSVLHFSFDRDDALENHVDQQHARWLGAEKPDVAEGREGRGIKLDGKDDRLEIHELPIAQPEHHAVTLAAWCFYEGGSGGILTKMDDTDDFHGIDFTIHNGIVEVHLVDVWPRNAIKVTTKTPLAKNEWHHLLMRYDASRKASGVEIFIDGQKQELQVHYDQLTGNFMSPQPWRGGSRSSGTWLQGRLDELRVYYRALDDVEVSYLAGDPRLNRFLEIAKKPIADRSAEERKIQIDFLLSKQPPANELKKRLDDLRKNPPQLQRGTGVGLSQRSDQRPTHVHIRGDFLKKGDEVAVGTPAFLHPLQIRGAQPDRLDLARWILSDDNGLTARVTVNRIWQSFFGRGLVESDRDFGSQGDAPTHPELLDWLAVEFKKSGWSMKHLHRLILNSATYQQSSAMRQDIVERDPYNQWLARQNRLRVEAEVVRDLALRSSGLLDNRVYGPSVFPPLPPGTVELAFVDVINRGPWKVSEGGDRYRRGLYTFFQRTSAYPMLTLFDAPDSNTSCTKRERSNTPLQSLALWNDPVFIECAIHLAKTAFADSVMNEQPEPRSVASQIYIQAMSREPDEADRNDLLHLYQASLDVYRNQPELATAVRTTVSVPSGMSEAEFAAWISVARTVMNLDGFITRE